MLNNDESVTLPYCSTKQRNMHTKLLEDSWFRETYLSFIRDAAIPIYVGPYSTEQDVLHVLRSVMGFFAERTELLTAPPEKVLDEAGDVLFWYFNFMSVAPLPELFWRLSFMPAHVNRNYTNLVEVMDSLEKWSRNPERKQEKLESVAVQVMIAFHYLTVDRPEILLDTLDICKLNFEKLTNNPRKV